MSLVDIPIVPLVFVCTAIAGTSCYIHYMREENKRLKHLSPPPPPPPPLESVEKPVEKKTVNMENFDHV